MKEFDMGNGAKAIVPEDVIPTLEKRKKIVDDYCKTKGWDQSNLAIGQILEIRKLPEWMNA